MMLLGVVFHTAISYRVTESPLWTFKDEATTYLADFIVMLIYLFRMPIFFVLAGFFAAMIFFRNGAKNFCHNRVARIALPFAVGWLFLHPLVKGGFLFANGVQEDSVTYGLSVMFARVMDGSLFFSDSTLHLWFLYDLMFFYAAALVLVPVTMCFPFDWRERFVTVFAAIIRQPLLRLSILVLATMGALLPMGGMLRTSTSFVPDWYLLLTYGFFFGFGWLLYLKRELVLHFDRFAWTQTLTGLVLYVVIGVIIGLLAGRVGLEFLIMILTAFRGAMVVWLLFFGLTGLFLRYLDHPSAIVRYVSDSSYWIYLIHLPLTIWLAGLLSALELSAWVKIATVMSITYSVGFATYELMVRSTFVGSALNGRRYRPGFLGAN